MLCCKPSRLKVEPNLPYLVAGHSWPPQSWGGWHQRRPQTPGEWGAHGNAPACQKWTGTRDAAHDTVHPRSGRDANAERKIPEQKEEVWGFETNTITYWLIFLIRCTLPLKSLKVTILYIHYIYIHIYILIIFHNIFIVKLINAALVSKKKKTYWQNNQIIISIGIYLCFALEVEGEDILHTPCLTLPHKEHSMAGHAARQYQLGCLKTGECAVEPLTLTQRMFHRVWNRTFREQERPCGKQGANWIPLISELMSVAGIPSIPYMDKSIGIPDHYYGYINMELVSLHPVEHFWGHALIWHWDFYAPYTLTRSVPLCGRVAIYNVTEYSYFK